MSERELNVPRLGRIPAAHGFRLVAAMNPFDAIGTARISSAVYDRVCRLAVDYQAPEEEEAIVARAVDGSASYPPDWLSKVVKVVRMTRVHADLRVGSSVRGAIDCALVARSLSGLRNLPIEHPLVGLDAALVALSGRIRLREGSVRRSEDIVREIWADVFGVQVEDNREGKVGAPTGATTSPS